MFRQDTKTPDRLSWISVHMQTVNCSTHFIILRSLLRFVGVGFLMEYIPLPIDEKKRGGHHFDGMVRLNKEVTDLRSVSVEFPYSHLKDYLVGRGFSDLAGGIPWENDDQDTMQKRSKHFINEKKSLIEFYFPDKTRELTRIESHIRLHSSLWFACLYLSYLSAAGLLLGIISLKLTAMLNFSSLHAEFVIIPGLVLVMSAWFQCLIEKSFHYQRTREVFYVLQYSKLAGGLLESKQVSSK